jgi:hypothetical protein
MPADYADVAEKGKLLCVIGEICGQLPLNLPLTKN